jgi:hypothetical protein
LILLRTKKNLRQTIDLTAPENAKDILGATCWRKDYDETPLAHEGLYVWIVIIQFQMRLLLFGTETAASLINIRPVHLN